METYLTVDELEQLIKRLKESGALTGKEKVWVEEDHTTLLAEQAHLGYVLDDDDGTIMIEEDLEYYNGPDISELEKVLYLLTF